MFEIFSPPAVDSAAAANGETEHPAYLNVEVTIPRMTDGGPLKIALPRRSGDPRFGPQQYYYQASRTGVLPSWCSAS